MAEIDRGKLGLWIAVAFFCAAALHVRPLLDPDLWFNMLAGQKFWESGSPPSAEFYVWGPAEGKPTIFAAWGFGALCFAAWKAAGYAGVSMLVAALFGGWFALSLAGASRSFRSEEDFKGGVVLPAAAAAMAVLFLATSLRSFARAETFLFLAWAAAYWADEALRVRADRREAAAASGVGGSELQDRKERLRFAATDALLHSVAPAGAWALAWIHSTSLMVVFYLAVSFLGRAWSRRRRLGPWLAGEGAVRALALAAALALPAANPFGAEKAYPMLENALHALDSAKKSSAERAAPGILADGRLSTVNAEYAGVFESSKMLPPFLALCLLAPLAWRADRKRRVENFVFYAGFALASVGAARSASLLAMAMAPGAILAFMDILNPRTASQGDGGQGSSIGFGAAQGGSVVGKAVPPTKRGAKVALSLFAFALVAAKYGSDPNLIGVGAPGDPFPMTKAVLESRYPEGGNLFNYFSFGSGLAWQGGGKWKVAMDGHFTKNYAEAFDHYDKILQMSDGWEAELDKAQAKAAVLLPLAPQYGYIPKLSFELLGSPKWRLVGAERNTALIFVRAEPGEAKDEPAERRIFWTGVLMASGPVASGAQGEYKDAALRARAAAITELEALGAEGGSMKR